MWRQATFKWSWLVTVVFFTSTFLLFSSLLPCRVHCFPQDLWRHFLHRMDIALEAMYRTRIMIWKGKALFSRPSASPDAYATMRSWFPTQLMEIWHCFVVVVVSGLTGFWFQYGVFCFYLIAEVIPYTEWPERVAWYAHENISSIGRQVIVVARVCLPVFNISTIDFVLMALGILLQCMPPYLSSHTFF